jgi:hypothetical protein
VAYVNSSKMTKAYPYEFAVKEQKDLQLIWKITKTVAKTKKCLPK